MDNGARSVSLLETPALAKLIAATPVVEYTAGETLFRSGEACVSLPVIESGNARIYASSITEQQLTLYHLKAGAICPISLSALLQHSTYPATAIADTSVQVRYLPGEKLTATISSTPEIFSAFLDAFTDCLYDSECTAHQLIVGPQDMKPERLLHDQLAESSDQPVDFTHVDSTSESGTTRVIASLLSSKH